MTAVRRTLFILLLQIIALKKCNAAVYSNPPGSLRAVSNEDIRDAILSLVNLFRDATDKLERHEARERQLGEQLKKSFAQVDRKQRAEESNAVTILEKLNSLDHRLEALENITNQAPQCNEQKILSDNSQEILLQKLGSLEQMIKNNSDQLQNIKLNVDQKLDSLVQNVRETQTTTILIQQSVAQFSDEQSQITRNNANKLDSTFALIQPQLQKFDEILELQKTSIQQTTTLLENTKNDSLTGNVERLIDSTYQQFIDLKQHIEKQVDLLKQKIGNTEEILSEKQQIIHHEISNSAKTNENLRDDTNKVYEKLLKELKGFSKMDQVLIQTADNVLDAKRRVEYGTHQILLEVGDLIKSSAKETNETINKRFDMISNEIVINQNDALKNLSTKIETEISKVWRQIGIMYQRLTSSADALDKLQQQTEIYVNGSLGTMENMQGKITQITNRMGEVDENLNYLLGRLSLVTQEFNEIKTGLSEALDNIRGSFHTVQGKMKDLGPGPNPIQGEIDTADSQLAKTKYTTE